MSIFIQFVQDNMALFVFTIIAAVVLVGAATALVVFTVKQKRAVKRSAVAVSAQSDADPIVEMTESEHIAEVEPEPVVAAENTAEPKADKKPPVKRTPEELAELYAERAAKAESQAQKAVERAEKLKTKASKARERAATSVAEKQRSE